MSDIDTFREQVTQALDGISPRPFGHLTGHLWLGNTLVWEGYSTTLADIVKATQVPRWYDVRLIFSTSSFIQELFGVSEAFIAALQMAYSGSSSGKHVIDYVDRDGAACVILIDTRDLTAAHIQPTKP